MSTGSEAFSLEANKFVLLSFFSLIKTIYPRVSTKPLPNDARSPLPVDVHRSKTLLLKLSNKRDLKIKVWLSYCKQQSAVGGFMYVYAVARGCLFFSFLHSLLFQLGNFLQHYLSLKNSSIIS